MKKQELLKVLPIAFVLLFAAAMVYGQGTGHDGHSASTASMGSIKFWFGILEFPFLFVCVYFAFATAKALKGGAFGKGMSLMAWGFLVMAIGHIHMQLDHFLGVNLFNMLLGEIVGFIAWVLALMITWSLSGLGFYNIYKASRGK